MKRLEKKLNQVRMSEGLSVGVWGVALAGEVVVVEEELPGWVERSGEPEA